MKRISAVILGLLMLAGFGKMMCLPYFQERKIPPLILYIYANKNKPDVAFGYGYMKSDIGVGDMLGWRR